MTGPDMRTNSHGRHRHYREAGAALAEFALVVPLFLAMVWGIVTLVSIGRAQLEVAIVAHAVMREAEAGVVEPPDLTGLARAYGLACGMGRDAANSLTVQ